MAAPHPLRRTLTLHHSPQLILPNVRDTVRHAIPNVVEGKVLPVVLFVLLLQVSGSTSALIGSLVFSVAALARRRLRREEVTGILILTTVGLLARTIAALATGSLLVYFLQPTITTALVGLTFVASVVIGKPLAERLMADVCPVDEETRSHPHLRRFLSHLSLWWAFTSAVNFSITLWVLLTHSPTTFVLVKSALGPLTTTATLAVGFIWFRAVMARSGTQVVFAPATTGSRRVRRR